MILRIGLSMAEIFSTLPHICTKVKEIKNGCYCLMAILFIIRYSI